MPRTVVLEDDGLFLMAGALLGVGHSPGYPIYTLIVHLFTRLPFGEAALLGHLSSAVLGALACGALALLGNSAVLIGLLAFDFDPFRLAMFRPYVLICYGVAALWAGVGLRRCWTAPSGVTPVSSACPPSCSTTMRPTTPAASAAGWPAPKHCAGKP